MPTRENLAARSRTIALLTGLCLLPLTPHPALAEDNPLTQPSGQKQQPHAADDQNEASKAENADAQATSPSMTEIIRSLAPFADGNPHAPHETRDVDADGRRKVRVDYSHAIDLTVFFKYDSDVLTPEAKLQLEPLGRALRSRELAPYRFLIAGHTDAAGDPVYNLNLSRRRAEAVRNHLISAYAIDPMRLLTRGWGAGRLKDAEHPLAGVNRRVEVALVTSARQSFFSEDVDTDAAMALEPDLRFGRDELRDGRWHLAGRAHCNPTNFVDPRHFPSDALDDFHSAPTDLCDLRFARRSGVPGQHYDGWTASRSGAFEEIDN